MSNSENEKEGLTAFLENKGFGTIQEWLDAIRKNSAGPTKHDPQEIKRRISQITVQTPPHIIAETYQMIKDQLPLESLRPQDKYLYQHQLTSFKHCMDHAFTLFIPGRAKFFGSIIGIRDGRLQHVSEIREGSENKKITHTLEPTA